MSLRLARFGEQLHAALRSLWANRLRSVLTTLGIIIGVASVIAVVQLTKSLEGRIMADVNQAGSHTFFLNPWTSSAVWRSGKKTRFQRLDPEVMRELRELVPQVQVTVPDLAFGGRQNMAKAGQVTRRVIIHLTDEHGLALTNLDLSCGRNFTLTDRAFRAPVVILGARLADDLGFTEASVGRSFTIGGQTVEIIGILKKQGEMPFMPQDEDAASWGPDNEVYAPFGSLRELMPPWAPMQLAWRIQVDPGMPIQEAEDRLRLALRQVRGLRGDDPDNFDLTTNRKQVEMVEKLSRNLLMAAAGMVSISLLVGGIGVMNIMLVSVSERTREIGIRKALGARRKTILAQFLIEAVLLCLVGGGIGLLLGLGLGHALSRLLLHHLGGLPWWAIAAGLGVPAATGVIFGLYPAAKASKLDPIEALRYE